MNPMGASSFISRRISFKGHAAVTSIAVSFLVMIIAISVAGGFRSGIRKGLAELMGDIRITGIDGQDGAPVSPDGGLVDEILAMDGVDEVRPVVYGTGIVRSGDNIHGVVFKGVETADSASLEVLVPARLASLLSLKPGDRMLSYFIGESVVPRNFTVKDTYDAVDTGDDRLVVFCDIHTLRRVNRWDSDKVSALEVILSDNYRNESASLMVNSRISHALYMQSGGDALISARSDTVYRQIFDWLRLIDFNVVFLLVLMTIVAGLNMISGLLILLFENIKTIGLLKSIGMNNRGISATFLKSSSRLVLRGMLYGNAAGIAICLCQQLTHLVKLNPENYFVSFLPMKVDWVMIASCDVLSFAAIMLILLIPCAFISRVDPAKSMRVK